MKREIKFRAWNGHNMFNNIQVGAMYLGDLIADPQWHLMQYTNLKDKNGREIYEGDIVRWGDMVGLDHEKSVRVAVVRFDPDICFDSNVGIFDYGKFAYKETDQYLTVIGNVYENPELLAAEK